MEGMNDSCRSTNSECNLALCPFMLDIILDFDQDLDLKFDESTLILLGEVLGLKWAIVHLEKLLH